MSKYLILFLFSSIAWGKPSKEYIQNSIVKAANKVGVPHDLLRAACWAESNHNPMAYNHNDGHEKNSAFGICQVLYTTAQKYGLKDAKCEEDFRDKERNYYTCKLFGPYTSAYYGALYLKEKLREYDGNWIQAIGAYNSGTFFLCREGFYKVGNTIKECRIGMPINWHHIRRVLNALGEL